MKKSHSTWRKHSIRFDAAKWLASLQGCLIAVKHVRDSSVIVGFVAGL